MVARLRHLLRALLRGLVASRPAIAPIAGASPAPMADAQCEEARALAISPLAYGADTGRRMAPTDAVEPLADTPERPESSICARPSAAATASPACSSAPASAAPRRTRSRRMIGERRCRSTTSSPGTMMDLTLGRRPNRRSPGRSTRSPSAPASTSSSRSSAVDGRLVLNRIPIAVDDTPLRIQGRVGASLYRSARAAGVPAKAVEAYIRALDQPDRHPPASTADDRFDIIVEHRRAATGETETGQVALSPASTAPAAATCS